MFLLAVLIVTNIKAAIANASTYEYCSSLHPYPIHPIEIQDS